MIGLIILALLGAGNAAAVVFFFIFFFFFFFFFFESYCFCRAVCEYDVPHMHRGNYCPLVVVIVFGGCSKNGANRKTQCSAEI
jgi:hypothetical protein